MADRKSLERDMPGPGGSKAAVFAILVAIVVALGAGYVAWQPRAAAMPPCPALGLARRPW
ncbi:MAG: hypothetical protein H0V36_10935 [Chloroflexi bacterium]|nr:hypothetical protein [Chloroflexota bacterium]